MNLKKCKEIRRALRALAKGAWSKSTSNGTVPWQAYVQEPLPQSNKAGAGRLVLHPQCGKARYKKIKQDIKRHGG